MSDIQILHSAPNDAGDCYSFRASIGKRTASVFFGSSGYLSICVENGSHAAWGGCGRTFWKLGKALDGYKTLAIKEIIRAGSVAALGYWRDLPRVDGRHELMVEICDLALPGGAERRRQSNIRESHGIHRH